MLGKRSDAIRLDDLVNSHPEILDTIGETYHHLLTLHVMLLVVMNLFELGAGVFDDIIGSVHEGVHERRRYNFARLHPNYSFYWAKNSSSSRALNIVILIYLSISGFLQSNSIQTSQNWRISLGDSHTNCQSVVSFLSEGCTFLYITPSFPGGRSCRLGLEKELVSLYFEAPDIIFSLTFKNVYRLLLVHQQEMHKQLL